MTRTCENTFYYLQTIVLLLALKVGEKIIRNEIHPQFVLKEESIGPPAIYLGGKLREVTLENEIKAGSFSFLNTYRLGYRMLNSI